MNNILYRSLSLTTNNNINLNSSHNNLNILIVNLNTNYVTNTNEHTENPQNNFFMVLSYIKEITPGLSKLFSDLQNVKIAFKTILTINYIYSRVKDKTAITSRTNMIYAYLV